MVPFHNTPAGTHRMRCPNCGRSERDKTLGVTIHPDGRGVAHCFRCNLVDFAHRESNRASSMPALPVRSPVRSPRTSLSEQGRRLWSSCHPILPGTIAANYLKARKCVVPPESGHLRWHPALPHGPSGHVGPALVALITDAVTGAHMSLHFTWIQADGRKADLDPPRLLLGKHRKQGGVIRLWPDEDVTYGLAVAEGIETALSIAHAYEPVWGCIDAGNLAALPVLPGVQTLVIAADNDPAGQAAAELCARRWASAGAEVLVTRQQANDLNDTLKEAA